MGDDVLAGGADVTLLGFGTLGLSLVLYSNKVITYVDVFVDVEVRVRFIIF